MGEQRDAAYKSHARILFVVKTSAAESNTTAALNQGKSTPIDAPCAMLPPHRVSSVNRYGVVGQHRAREAVFDAASLVPEAAVYGKFYLRHEHNERHFRGAKEPRFWCRVVISPDIVLKMFVIE